MSLNIITLKWRVIFFFFNKTDGILSFLCRDLSAEMAPNLKGKLMKTKEKDFLNNKKKKVPMVENVMTLAHNENKT